MVRITDVADLAKVSPATVSRVLSNEVKVSSETKKKVLDAIEKLNYRPNVLARQLRRMETKTIMVIVPDITNPFFSKVLKGIESVARKKGYKVLLGNTDNDIGREKEYLELLHHKQIDGTILLTARMEGKYITEWADQYPVVLACEYLEGSLIPTVSIDNVSASRKATEHLIKLGHRCIGFISGPMNIILSKDRLKGYHQALAQNEIEVEPLLIQEGDYSSKSGFNMMLKFLALENPPTAVFASSDEMAIGALKAVKINGFHVPGDISIVGFDGITLGEIVEPAITTIVQPMYQIGYKAMELLLNLIEDRELPKKQLMLADKLIIRESCGAKMIRDTIVF
ncbi:LacI family transcriptional regulator [Peribacillus cavernae]|uniref:LacI family transcriptional regulator n=1 Tax=Peribacillus cavernae TaxID=1674310 RepID=A0A3S0VVS0_9BACI|nr:LacI family DNA-binding transcriptional regulator [Peribacillus cavernae]MDQ0219426.1 LacI family repressor for deo operon, udp, cdd, tsx, nupC, and nupG [Peribacillus cavernae]RUQ27148.1 LacI family transcriptional regulator [Peribacillus cavernae]